MTGAESVEMEIALRDAGFIRSPIGDAWVLSVATTQGAVLVFSWTRDNELVIHGMFPFHGETYKVDYILPHLEVTSARINVVRASVSAVVNDLVKAARASLTTGPA